MRRVALSFISCLAILLLINPTSAANLALRVDESATKVSLEDEQTNVSLAIDNSRPTAITARVRVEIVDAQNIVRASAERDELIKPGKSALGFALNLRLSALRRDESRQVLWHRLRYKIIPHSMGGATLDSINGIISLSQITPDLFELKVVKPIIAVEGSRYRVLARAAHPVSSRPAKGVSVDAEIKLAQAQVDSTLKASAVTDAEGYAVFDFDLPGGVSSSEGEIKLTGRRGGVIKEAEGTIRFDRAARIAISTDKPIYQPGQALHVRALVFSPSQRAMANTDLTVKIQDPESTVVYRAKARTSRFGITSADWTIPENVRLGDYEIRFDINEDDQEDSYAYRHTVRISRYELPNFAVTVKPDRGYYLPGQNAEIEVQGRYLFGQPVTRARVRVVEEDSREWNYREQKWDIEEGDKYEGELDSKGRFLARIDLAKAHKELSENDYSRFTDISFAAYITDLTTNRTEQRRFDLRVTREAIHVYVIESEPRTTKLPLEFYITTFYADGAPAPCEVKVGELLQSREERAYSGDASERLLRVVRTNRYGVAKISDLGLKPRNADGERVILNFKARGAKGQTGHKEEWLWLNSHDYLRVTTDKSLYRKGEPIKAQIRSSEPDGKVFVDVAREWKVIRSEIIQLRNGRASITLPYAEDFKDEITIAAYTHEKTYSIGTRTVLYPHDRELKIKVKTARSDYRPGEEASAAFTVQSSDGRAVESALGVAVIDQAVEERARADVEFGSRNGFYRTYQRLWGGEENVGGVTRASLDKLDVSKPISAELDLIAEVLLRRRGYASDSFDSSDYEASQPIVFRRLIEAQLEPVKNALNTRYARKREYPTNESRLADILNQFGIDINRMRDPWGTAYRAKFSVNRDNDTLTIATAGADKRFDTEDDFVALTIGRPYFTPIGEMINRAVEQFHKRTGGFIRDAATFKRELLRQGLNFDAVLDRWGRPYKFEFGISRSDFTVVIKSGGKNRRIEMDNKYGSDDFILWTAKIDYFAATRAKVDAALTSYFKATARFPQDEIELAHALKQSGIAWNELSDAWGNRYYASFKAQSRYSDRVSIYTYAMYNEEPRRRTDITPITQTVNFVQLRSVAEDGKPGGADDFDAANFSRVVAELSSRAPEEKQSSQSATLLSGMGAIAGTVVDTSGAAIANTKVKATHKASSKVFETTTSEDGGYLLRNLPAGSYEMGFDAPGFKSLIIADVPVRDSNVTELIATLEAGTVTETVMVTAADEGTQTLNSEVRTISELPLNGRGYIQALSKSGVSTPRLREYFPETLVWQPSLETDAEGRAQLKFKLADNITTWKIGIIASTIEGEIGMAEEELRAFQPFFIEHDPPRVLTEGDEISLPVVLRNYLGKRLSIDVEIKSESWFALVGPARKRAEVAAGDAARETFGFRVIASTNNGKQRITATGAEAGDAIEKPITAHPDGEEITVTASQVFAGSSTLEINVPESAINNTARAELKIYSNLMAHVVESIEAIMQRPYGCAEQTISSAYPSLLALRYYKRRGEDFPAVAQKARRYLQAGYERLLNYRDEDGGFTYWGRGDADTALTAYALRFLNDAREFIAVDEEIIRDARRWLINQQGKDGSWAAPSWSGAEDKARAAMLTSLVARSLASTKRSAIDETDAEEVKQEQAGNAALKRAIDYLSARSAEINEPYLLASAALAAMDASQTDAAKQSVNKLRSLARNEGDGSYWALETNTPFYGWGLAGRIETTALAVQALARSNAETQRRGDTATGNNSPRHSIASSQRHQASADDLINRGLLFLIRQKDRYGVWYSTQATVNVLDALTALLSGNESNADRSQPAEIFVNGKRAASAAMPPEDQPANPVTIDLSKFLSIGPNRVEIRHGGALQATAQLVASYYASWTAPATAVARKADPEASGALRLKVSFDKNEAKIGDEITCRIEAERIGHRGYGMMLAEIGLPPGADVDRSSLERAMNESGWAVNQYDVLPDRVVLYLWPEAGGVKFDFKFRPRFGLAAKTAPSVLYDYYNPEARVVIAPSKFSIK